MENIHFVISFRVQDHQKEFFYKSIGNIGKVTFLKDIPEENRASILNSTDILIAWNPLKELKNIEREKLKNIKFVQLVSAGYDHIDLNQFPSGCIIACNSGAYAEPMAEHIIGMILALSKYFLVKHQMMAKGKFDQLSENRTLKGAVCGIIGFGGIGKATAKLLRAFGTEIYAINSSGKTNEDVGFTGTLKDLDHVLSKSDVIIVSIPLNEETKNLIRKRELELMKPNAIIINVARGAVINEKDLFFHLKSHQEFLAGIDAWWNEPFANGSFKLEYPFFELPNFLGSPHNSAVVPGSLVEGARRAIENVMRFLEREEVRGIIQNRE